MKYDDAALKALIADSRYSDIGNLPSGFFPYKREGISKLFVRPFKVDELRLISKAAALDDESHLVRAVDLCISMDAGELTFGDFFYVLMWLRMHSMPKTPYVIEWHCQEVVIINKETGVAIMNDDSFEMPKDEENYRVDPCGTHNSEVIHLTNIDVQSLPEDFAGLPDDGPLEFDFPRAKLLQDVRMSRALPELQYLVRAAQWVKDGATIEDKVNLLATQDDLSVFGVADELDDRFAHGVAENASLCCRRCLKRTPHRLHLDALTFFR